MNIKEKEEIINKLVEIDARQDNIRGFMGKIADEMSSIGKVYLSILLMFKKDLECPET